ncbi:MAG: hypothetical protein ABSC13_07575 [Dehalococcoidia bacterium]|jgi:hypothetical protein
MAYAGVEEEPAAPSLRVVKAGPGFRRMFFKWAVGLVFVSTLGVLLLAVDATQLSAAGPSHAILRRTVSSLTEIDALLASPGQATVGSSGDTAPSRLQDFPIALDLTTGETQDLSSPDLRNVVLDRSADKLYADGFSAFHAGDTNGASHIQVLSPPGAVRYTAGLLTKSNHDVMRIVLIAAAALAAILALALMLLSRGYRRLTTLGAAVLAAALPLLLIATVVHFVLQLAAAHESDYLNAQLYALGRDVAWLPVRNALAFACLGAVFVALGVTFSLLSKERRSVLR